MVYTDASGTSLGCVLMKNGKVEAYASHQLKSHEKNYLIMTWSSQPSCLPLRFGDISYMVQNLRCTSITRA